jgi:hypothetical protein
MKKENDQQKKNLGQKYEGANENISFAFLCLFDSVFFWPLCDKRRI